MEKFNGTKFDYCTEEHTLSNLYYDEDIDCFFVYCTKCGWCDKISAHYLEELFNGI